MIWQLGMALSLSCVLACGHAGSSAVGGRVLDRGGELAQVRLEEKKPTVTPSSVTTWGVIEVPEGARMQAAHAGADAIARSELLKLIRVRVADVMVGVDSTDPARRDAFEHTVEAVSGVLRHAGTTHHSWERVQQGDRIILRIWSRLRVPRADVDAAFQAARTEAGPALPANILEELGPPPS